MSLPNNNGFFITFEGGEGTGKTTQAEILAQKLKKYGKKVLLTREPGGSKGSEIIRNMLLDKDYKWTFKSELLLYFVARDDHLTNTIKPALARGEWVICDRFIDSSIVYQGTITGIDISIINYLGNFIIGKYMPKLTLILDVPVEHSILRKNKLNRYDNMSLNIHKKLRKQFQNIALKENDRCTIIDAFASQEKVAKRIWNVVSTHFTL